MIAIAVGPATKAAAGGRADDGADERPGSDLARGPPVERHGCGHDHGNPAMLVIARTYDDIYRDGHAGRLLEHLLRFN